MNSLAPLRSRTPALAPTHQPAVRCAEAAVAHAARRPAREAAEHRLRLRRLRRRTDTSALAASEAATVATSAEGSREIVEPPVESNDLLGATATRC